MSEADDRARRAANQDAARARGWDVRLPSSFYAQQRAQQDAAELMNAAGATFLEMQNPTTGLLYPVEGIDYHVSPSSLGFAEPENSMYVSLL